MYFTSKEPPRKDILCTYIYSYNVHKNEYFIFSTLQNSYYKFWTLGVGVKYNIVILIAYAYHTSYIGT